MQLNSRTHIVSTFPFQRRTSGYFSRLTHWLWSIMELSDNNQQNLVEPGYRKFLFLGLYNLVTHFIISQSSTQHPNPSVFIRNILLLIIAMKCIDELFRKWIPSWPFYWRSTSSIYALSSHHNYAISDILFAFATTELSVFLSWPDAQSHHLAAVPEQRVVIVNLPERAVIVEPWEKMTTYGCSQYNYFGTFSDSILPLRGTAVKIWPLGSAEKVEEGNQVAIDSDNAFTGIVLFCADTSDCSAWENRNYLPPTP